MARGAGSAGERGRDARRGAIGIVCIGAVLAVLLLHSTGRLGGPPQVSAILANAGGSLRHGSDVKYRGVVVGQVVAIEPSPEGRVRVDMAMRDVFTQVPGNVVARILPATVFGTTYVDLAPRGRSTGSGLRSGQVIAADTRYATVEMQQALDDVDALVKAIQPSQLSSLLGSFATALQGRGRQIQATVVRAVSYFDKLDSAMPRVRADARALARSLDIVSGTAADYLRAADDLTSVARTVVANRHRIAATIGSSTELAIRAQRLLSAYQARLVLFVDQLEPMLDATYDNRRAAITGAVGVNLLLGPALTRLVLGGGADGNGTLDLSPPPYYASGDCPRYGVAVGDNCPR